MENGNEMWDAYNNIRFMQQLNCKERMAKTIFIFYVQRLRCLSYEHLKSFKVKTICTTLGKHYQSAIYYRRVYMEWRTEGWAKMAVVHGRACVRARARVCVCARARARARVCGVVVWCGVVWFASVKVRALIYTKKYLKIKISYLGKK